MLGPRLDRRTTSVLWKPLATHCRICCRRRPRLPRLPGFCMPRSLPLYVCHRSGQRAGKVRLRARLAKGIGREPWWWRSCASAAYVEPSLRPPFIHLQPKTINKNRSSVRFDGWYNIDLRNDRMSIDILVRQSIDETCESSVDFTFARTCKNPIMQFDLHGTQNPLNRSVFPIILFLKHKSIDINSKISVQIRFLFQP